MKKFTDLLVQSLVFFCALCMMGLTIVVLLQVISRHLQISLTWSDELARFLLIWLTFSGAALAIDYKMHLSVNFLVDLAAEAVQKYIKYFAYTVIIFFQMILVIFGFKLSLISIDNLSPTMQWSMGLVYLVIPVTAIISIYLVIYRLLTSDDKEELTC